MSRKKTKRDVDILTPDEVRAIINATSRRGQCGVRDRALIAVLYRAGLRCAEALALVPKDVNLDSGVIEVQRGKGSKHRTVAADPETIALIRHWLAVRERRGIGTRKTLFCTLCGGRLDDSQTRKHVKRLASKAGVDKRVHPHAFRHTFAAELADEKTDVRIIQKALGHGSLSTTTIYISHLRPTAVIDTLRARTWNPEESA